MDRSSLGKDAVGWWGSPEPRTWPEVKWDYDRAEFLADGAVHALGVTLSVAGVLSLIVEAARASPLTHVAAVVVYGVGLLTVLCVSATYNLWPVSPTKWLLRRFDHAAIYLLIASTYTPFLLHIAGSPLAPCSSSGFGQRPVRAWVLSSPVPTGTSNVLRSCSTSASAGVV